MLGEPILRLDECDSTNRVALDWDNAPDGACVVSRVQTQGRGRLGRKWESALGKGLYLSLVLRRRVAQAPLYSLLSALGVAWAVHNLTGVNSRVKWPNDVLAVSSSGEARKIGGILGEARGDKLVIGIGLNLNQSRDELPERPLFPASSLSLESGREWGIETVLEAVLFELAALFGRLETGDWDALRAEFEAACLGIGEPVSVSGNEKLIGIFESIGADGALLLRTNGGLKRVVAGDVSYF